MVALQVDAFVLPSGLSVSKPCTPDLKITAKRYRTTSEKEDRRTLGVTLLFTHSIGAHKEQWEPTIEALFTSSRRTVVREAWSLDWQSHGDAAVANRQLLMHKPGECVSIYQWAVAISNFVKSDLVRGHRIVAIGHSAGAGAIVLSTKHLQSSPYAAIILVEPAIITKDLFEATIDDRMDQMELAVRMTMARRDTWSNRDEAFRWLSQRYPWSGWDPRVLRAFTDHGLEDIPAGVRLKCERLHEAASYPDVEGHFESAELLSRLHQSSPIHLIWGDNPDIIPDEVRKSISDVSAGRVTSSVKFVEGAGHLVVQEQPDGLAKALRGILDEVSSVASRSRL